MCPPLADIQGISNAFAFISDRGEHHPRRLSNFANILKSLDVSKALVVLEDDNKNAELSARNIADIKTAKTNTINVYDILKYNTVITTKAVVAKIEEVYA